MVKSSDGKGAFYNGNDDEIIIKIMNSSSYS